MAELRLQQTVLGLSYLMDIDGSYTADRCETKGSETAQHTALPLQHQLFHGGKFWRK